MKKILLTSFLVLLAITSCSKQASEMIPDSLSWANIETPVWSIKTNENGINVSAWENSIWVWNDWVNISTAEENVWLNSSWMELNSKEWNIKMDENGMTSNIEWVWNMSITNTWTQIWDINISSWNMAQDFAWDAINNELNNLEMNLDSAVKNSQTMWNWTMSQE